MLGTKQINLTAVKLSRRQLKPVPAVNPSPHFVENALSNRSASGIHDGKHRASHQKPSRGINGSSSFSERQ